MCIYVYLRLAEVSEVHDHPSLDFTLPEILKAGIYIFWRHDWHRWGFNLQIKIQIYFSFNWEAG